MPLNLNMGTESSYKIIAVDDLAKYDSVTYYELRTSLNGTQVILEFPDPTGISHLQTLDEVHIYMHANDAEWIDYREIPD